MKSSPNFAVRGVLPILACASAAGVDWREVLARHAVDPAELGNPEGRLSLEALCGVWEGVAEASGDPLFALHAAAQTKNFFLDLPELVFCSSVSFRNAGERLGKFFELLGSNVFARILPEAQGRFVYRLGSGAVPLFPSRQIAEFALTRTMMFVRRLLDDEWTPLEVRFQYPAPGEDREYRRVLGCPVRFSHAHNELLLDGRDMDRPFLAVEPAFAHYLDRQAENLLGRLVRGEKTTHQVKLMLESSLPKFGRNGLALAARELGVSSRTLQRRLKEEGTSFQELLDEVRRDAALYAAREMKLTAAEVNALVGFENLSTFYRAYRRWAGTRWTGRDGDPKE